MIYLTDQMSNKKVTEAGEVEILTDKLKIIVRDKKER